MGGSDGGIIIRNLRAALSVSVTRSGKVVLWHAVLAFGAVCFVAGAVLL